MDIENNLEILKRIFVVGCPRSGTTLLQGMLSSHSQIHSFPETHFFSEAFPRNFFKRKITWPALNIHNTLYRYLNDIGRLDLISILEVGIFDRNYTKDFVCLLDRLTFEAGKNIWVEKTPRHLHFINEIEKRISQVRFIHLIRNGPDAVASLYLVKNENVGNWAKGKRVLGKSIKKCIDRWNNDVNITAKYQNHQHHCVVYYENLVNDPEMVARKISSFLNINYADEMKKPQKSFEKIVRSEEKWKSNNAFNIYHPGNKFENIFTDNEKRYIKSNLLNIKDVFCRG